MLEVIGYVLLFISVAMCLYAIVELLVYYLTRFGLVYGESKAKLALKSVILALVLIFENIICIFSSAYIPKDVCMPPDICEDYIIKQDENKNLKKLKT